MFNVELPLRWVDELIQRLPRRPSISVRDDDPNQHLLLCWGWTWGWSPRPRSVPLSLLLGSAMRRGNVTLLSLSLFCIIYGVIILLNTNLIRVFHHSQILLNDPTVFDGRIRRSHITQILLDLATSHLVTQKMNISSLEWIFIQLKSRNEIIFRIFNSLYLRLYSLKILFPLFEPFPPEIYLWIDV